MIGPFFRLGLFGLLALAVITASGPASASKKRSRSDESEETPKKKASDDTDEDAPRPAKPSGKSTLSVSSGLPDWREGTGWTVKSVYRKLPVGHVNKDVKPDEVSVPGWSAPTYWSFLVKKVKSGQGITQYLLQVRNKDGSRAAMASLYFAQYPVGTDVLALNRGKFYTLMAGQLKPISRPYVTPGSPPHPVMADDSLIPYDFPALPFQAKAPPGVKETELARTFTITEELDGVKYARDVTQVELQNTPVEAFGGKELAEYISSKDWSKTDLSLVEMRRKFDGRTVRQVWSPKLPWPIYSDSTTVRSWLWDLEAPKADPRAERDPAASPSPAPSAQE